MSLSTSNPFVMLVHVGGARPWMPRAWAALGLSAEAADVVADVWLHICQYLRPQRHETVFDVRHGRSYYAHAYPGMHIYTRNKLVWGRLCNGSCISIYSIYITDILNLIIVDMYR